MSKFTIIGDTILNHKVENVEKVSKSGEIRSDNVDYFKSLGLIGRLPGFGADKSSNTKKANRYLHFQEKRIIDKVNKGEFESAILI